MGISPAGGRGLANFDQLPTRGPLWLGKCICAGELVEAPPVLGPACCFATSCDSGFLCTPLFGIARLTVERLSAVEI
jgi:hypothetical protein